VLCHCANGSNRSATVAVALVMELRGLTLATAWALVCARRPLAAPLRDNRAQLLDFERQQRGKVSMQEGVGGTLVPLLPACRPEPEPEPAPGVTTAEDTTHLQWHRVVPVLHQKSGAVQQLCKRIGFGPPGAAVVAPCGLVAIAVAHWLTVPAHAAKVAAACRDSWVALEATLAPLSMEAVMLPELARAAEWLLPRRSEFIASHPAEFVDDAARETYRRGLVGPFELSVGTPPPPPPPPAYLSSPAPPPPLPLPGVAMRVTRGSRFHG
jgi:hypothetical protein